MAKWRIVIDVDGNSYSSSTDSGEGQTAETVASGIYAGLHTANKMRMEGPNGEFVLFSPEAIRRSVIIVYPVED